MALVAQCFSDDSDWSPTRAKYITVKLVLENNDLLKLTVCREERTSVNLSVSELAKKNLTFFSI